jgi:hypothetical protein
MAVGITSAFVTLFEAEVKQAYQAKRALAGLTRERMNVEGSTVKFPKIGKGTATLRIPQTDVTPMNVGYSQVTATMQDWNAAEYSDIFHQAKVNFEERSELVQVVASAIGRRMDQLVIDALIANTTSLTIGNDQGGTDTNLNVSKLRRAKALLDTNNVPAEGRTLLCHAKNIEGLLAETEVASSDFNTIKALVQGEINTFLGFKFVTIGDRGEGGLTVDGSPDRTIFAFHKDAVGIGVGIGMKTEINYVPEKTSYLVNGMFSAGAVEIDAEGIVEIVCRETA